MDTRSLYHENKDFHDYVDRYCKKYVEGKSISLEEAFNHILVKEVAEFYTTKPIEAV